MGRRISKEFLHPSILEGVNNKIGNLDSLETDAKGNMVQAINELVEKLDNSAEIENGKELIANAVGEPLTVEESFDEMSNDINSLLSTFKTNMMNNGITVESGDRFKSLIDKIATMVEEGSGKGVQFDSGIITSSTSKMTFTDDNNSTYDMYYFSLDYEPTILLIDTDFIQKMSTAITGEGSCSIIYNSLENKDTFVFSSSGTAGTASKFVNLNINNNNGKLCFPIVEWDYNSNYKNSLSEGKYYAIGVGEEDNTLRDSLASILQEEGVSVTEEDDMAGLISKVDQEFDRQVIPAGDAVASDVLSGKTFINSTGQLVTGTASKGLATATGTVNVSSTFYTSKSFSVNIPFTPTRLILIVPKVWYNGGVIEHENVIVTNETTTLNAGPNENGTIKVSSMTKYSFNIQMSGLQIPSCTITWIAFG